MVLQPEAYAFQNPAQKLMFHQYRFCGGVNCLVQMVAYRHFDLSSAFHISYNDIIVYSNCGQLGKLCKAIFTFIASWTSLGVKTWRRHISARVSDFTTVAG